MTQGDPSSLPPGVALYEQPLETAGNKKALAMMRGCQISRSTPVLSMRKVESYLQTLDIPVELV